MHRLKKRLLDALGWNADMADQISWWSLPLLLVGHPLVVAMLIVFSTWILLPLLWLWFMSVNQ